jgi:hypothetical protein
MRTLLSTVLRGLRSRLLLSLGSIVLTALAVGSAVLGPAFQGAVTSSFLVTRLAEAPANLTGLSWRWTQDVGQGSDVDATIERAVAAAEQATDAAGPGARSYLPPQVFLRSNPTQGLGGLAQLGWAPGYCDHLVIEGECPDRPDEVLLLALDSTISGLGIGDTTPVEGLGEVRIVGTYATPGLDEEDYWFEFGRLTSRPPGGQPANTPFQPAPMLTTKEAMADVAATNGYEVLVDRRLDVPADLTVDDLEQVAEVARAQDDLVLETDEGTLSDFSINDIDGVVAEVRDQQATARASVSPAVISLVLVALALLLRLLTAAADLRMPELALASLRGLPRRRMWSLGMSEPLTLLALALPVGGALGVGTVLLLIQAWLVPGLPLRVPWTSIAAGGLVGLGAAVVALAAVGLVVRIPLEDQLSGVRRPRRARRAAVVAQLALVAAAAAVLLSKLSSTERGRPDVTDLVLPVLLAVVAGLGASRLTASLATWWTRAVPHTRSLGAFVAVRALSRRQEGTLVILPVTAAIAICVFGAGVYDSSSAWRASVAATRAPAAQVWTSNQDLEDTVGLTRTLDPDGRWLMAGSTLATPQPGPVFSILDTTRLARVALWNDQWTPGTSPEEIADLLSTGPVPVVTGRRIGLQVDNAVEADPDLVLRLRLVPPKGRPRTIFLGPVERGASQVDAAAPYCQRGCRVEALTLGGPAALPVTMSGTLRVGAVLVDGTPDTAAMTDGGWALLPDGTGNDAVDDVELGADGLAVTVSADSPVIVELGAGDPPAALPVVAGETARTTNSSAAYGSGTALDFEVDPVLTAHSVPLLGPRGVLIDYDTFSTGREVYDQDTEVYVLARDDTPDDVVAAMRDAGLVEDTTYAEVKSELDGTAYALALRLYAVVAALVLLMAVASLAVSTAVQLPARRRDAAALRVVGVPRRQVMGAVLRELVLVLGGTAVAGLAAGSLAQYVVLRTVTLGYAETLSTPALVAAIDPARLALLAVLTALLFGTVALTSAVLTVRGARGSTLRESAR